MPKENKEITQFEEATSAILRGWLEWARHTNTHSPYWNE